VDDHSGGETSDWFERVANERVQRRETQHGVRAQVSTVETLLDLAREVVHGRTAIVSHPIALDRAGLAAIDASLLAWRRARAQGTGRRSEHGEVMAAAAFFLAVVLHELDAIAIDTGPDDGGCKVQVPSGAGARPILVASAYSKGTGQGLVETFDRLAHATRSTMSPPGQPGAPSAPSGYFPATRPPSITSMPAVRPPSLAGLAAVRSPSTPGMGAVRPPSIPAPPASVPPPGGGTSTSRSSPPGVPRSAPPPRRSAPPPPPDRPVPAGILTVTRAAAEASPVLLLDAAPGPPLPPPVDLRVAADTFTHSPSGLEIASRSGYSPMAMTPTGVEALESYCVATRGEVGSAPGEAEWETSTEEEASILAWGAFLGETLIGLYGGYWECDPASPTDARRFRVVCRKRVVAWPMAQVYLRLKNGERAGLLGFLAKVGQLLSR
jgi:hypothetical protein